MKMIKNISFIVICIVVLLIAISFGIKLATWKYENEHYGYMKVKWNDNIGTCVSNLEYGDKSLNNYDLYLPALKKDNYSLIIFIHGGGFTQGDKIDGKWMGKYFASKGYVVASVNYSLNEIGSDYKLTEKNEELRKALTKIVEQTDKIGYPLKEFAVSGDSAGGYLALMLALQEPGDLEIPVRFAFTTSAPACFEPMQWNAKIAEEQIAFVSSMCGQQIQADDVEGKDFYEIVKRISPNLWVDENSCPIIIAYGTNDKIVPTNLKYHLIEALEENHVTYNYIEFPNSGHGLAGDSDKLQEYYNAVNQYVERYFTQ